MQTAIPCRLLPTREQTLEPPIPPESLLVPRQLYQQRPSSPPLDEMLYRPASADRLPSRAWTSRTPAFPARIEPSFGPAAAARPLALRPVCSCSYLTSPRTRSAWAGRFVRLRPSELHERHQRVAHRQGVHGEQIIMLPASDRGELRVRKQVGEAFAHGEGNHLVFRAVDAQDGQGDARRLRHVVEAV